MVYLPSMAVPAVAYLASILLFLYVAGTFSGNEFIKGLVTIIVSVFLLFVTLFAYINWLINYLKIQVITDAHIVDIDQLNLFSRKISELDLEEIQDISATKKGVLQDFLNYGDVVIQTAGERENFIFDKIPEPDQLARDVMLIRDQYNKNKRGFDLTMSNRIDGQKEDATSTLQNYFLNQNNVNQTQSPSQDVEYNAQPSASVNSNQPFEQN